MDCLCQDHLPLGDGKGLIRQIPSLVLTREFQISWKILLLGEVETIIKIGIKSWFGDSGLAQVTPFWACSLFFNRTMNS